MEQILAVVNNDINSSIYKLVLLTNEQNETIKLLYKDEYAKEKLLSRELLNINQLNQDGIILEQRHDTVILSLHSHNFDLYSGGTIIVSTVLNGYKGTRREYDFELAKDKNGWSLFHQGHSIKQLLLEANKVALLGVVGIKNLIMH